MKAEWYRTGDQPVFLFDPAGQKVVRQGRCPACGRSLTCVVSLGPGDTRQDAEREAQERLQEGHIHRDLCERLAGQPTRETLNKVSEIAYIKRPGGLLSRKDRALSSSTGLYVWGNELPGDRWLVRAGPRSIFAKLIYIVEPDGRTTIKKYHPGDWEAKVHATWELAHELQSAALEREEREPYG